MTGKALTVRDLDNMPNSNPILFETQVTADCYVRLGPRFLQALIVIRLDHDKRTENVLVRSYHSRIGCGLSSTPGFSRSSRVAFAFSRQRSSRRLI
jgi:hypothetical protein